MDLLRRQAAGELAEIIGPAVVKVDRRHRVHRFRERARAILAAASPAERALLDGLRRRGERRPLLARRQAVRVPAAARRPGALAAGGLDPRGLRHVLRAQRRPRPPASPTSAPPRHAPRPDVRPPRRPRHRVGRAAGRPGLRDAADPRTRGVRSAQAPGAAEVGRAPCEQPPVDDLAEAASAAATTGRWRGRTRRTATRCSPTTCTWGSACRTPGTARRWCWPDGRGGTLRVTGVTLPGTPTLAVGSNGHVAWGFTNSYGDWTDLVELEVDPKDPEVYRTPQGPRRFTTVQEHIRVKGGADDMLEVKETIWGPVIDKDHLGRPPRARLDRAPSGGGEPADRPARDGGHPGRGDGDRQPLRHPAAELHRGRRDRAGSAGRSSAGSRAASASTGGPRPRGPTARAAGTAGWRRKSTRASSIRPPAGSGRRTPGWATASCWRRLGNGGYDLGARAQQIRDDLMKLERATPADLLAVQLDDRALFLERWRDLLLKELDAGGDPGASRARRAAPPGGDRLDRPGLGRIRPATASCGPSARSCENAGLHLADRPGERARGGPLPASRAVRGRALADRHRAPGEPARSPLRDLGRGDARRRGRDGQELRRPGAPPRRPHLGRAQHRRTSSTP